jgi:hypothetical protein
MILARESSDVWARCACQILDKARQGHGLPEHIEWALAYLGDSEGSVKIPRSLMTGHREVTA